MPSLPVFSVNDLDRNSERRRRSRLEEQIAQEKLGGVRDDRQRRSRLADLRPFAVSGDKRALQGVASIDPAEAKQIQEFIATSDEQQRAALDRSFEIQGNLALGVLQSDNPAAAYTKALEIAQRGGIDTSSLPPTYSEELRPQLEVLVARAKLTKELLGGEPLVSTFDESSPTGATLTPRSDAAGLPAPAPSGTTLSVNPQTGQVDFRQGRGVTQGAEGNVGLQKPVATAIQKELAAQDDQLGRVLQIQERFDPDFLTFQGRGAAFFTGLKSKADRDLSPEEREFVTRRKQFEFLVERDFNAYRRLITGAAASVQELESLKKAALNTDLSPVEFEATMGIYLSELKRGMRLRRRLLREGINVGDEKVFGDAYDGAFLGGADDDPEARTSELRDEGFTDDEIGDQLLDEGYGDVVTF